MVLPLPTCNVNACVPDLFLESVTLALTAYALAKHAVPESVTWVALTGVAGNAMPVGSPVADHVNGAVPPSSVTVSL